MKQVLVGGYYNQPSVSAVEYTTLAGSGWVSTLSNREQCIPTAGSLSNLLVELTDAPGSSKEYNFAPLKNGSDSDLAVTIAGSDTSGSCTTETLAFSAGDLVSLQCTPDSTPAATYARWSMFFTPDLANEFILLGTSSKSDGNTIYCPVNSIGGYSPTEESEALTIIPAAGTLKKLYVNLDAAPGNSDSIVVTLRKSGSNTALTVTISGSDTTGNDTTHSVAVAAGEDVSISVTATGTPATLKVKFGLVFVPISDAGIILGCDTVNPSSSSVGYASLNTWQYGG